MLEQSERERVYIDTDVASGLTLDSEAPAAVEEYRSNGYQVVISPSVVYEIARAPIRHRRRIVGGLVRHCDGFSNEQAPEIMRMELRGLVEGVRVVRASPPQPIAELLRLNDPRFVIERLGNPEAEEPLPDVQILESVIRDLKGVRLPPFEEYLMEVAGRLGAKAMQANLEDVDALKGKSVADATAGAVAGFATTVAYLAANVWRRKHGLGKGKGTLSDIRQLVEAAYGVVFLTRDVDLFETYQLVRTAVTDARPAVRLVPRPGLPVPSGRSRHRRASRGRGRRG